MLAPKWEDHDIETNPIINYFADRQHTELILRKIEQKIKTYCFYCNECEKKTFFGTEKCSNNMAFGLLTKTLNAVMFMTQTGANATKTLDSCRLENIKFQVLGIF